MIQIGTRVKIFIGLDPIDFRKAYKGISAIVRNSLKEDPQGGHIFVFKNKKADSVKMICFDGRASWTFHVKFSKGRLQWWPKDGRIQASQLMALLSQNSEIESTQLFRDIADF